MSIKESIRNATRAKKETYKSISEKLNIGSQTYANMICRDNIQSKNLEKIADALNCDIVLLDRENGSIY